MSKAIINQDMDPCGPEPIGIISNFTTVYNIVSLNQTGFPVISSLVNFQKYDSTQ